MPIKQDWFTAWFDSPYYPILYKDRNYQEAEEFIKKLLAFLDPEQKAKALDLACGRGRHSVALADYGLEVTGADLSPSSIEEAKKLKNENLHFIIHDMRQIIEPKAYNYVFNLFTSFGYFRRFVDNLQTINAVHAMLQEKGILVLDFLNTVKTINKLVRSETKIIDNIRFEIERRVEKGIITKTIYLSDGAIAQRFEENLQALKLEDFEAYFYNKFKIKAIFGDYELNPFDENNSDRLILIGEKICG